MSTTVTARECRFVVHIPSYDADRPDVHWVKEQVHYDDGRVEPHVRLIKDFQRPFWITKPAFRDHEQKKEWEQISKVDEYLCTQSDLRMSVAKALGKPYSREGLRQLSGSPYLYGSDLPASVLIKKGYQTRWPAVNTPYTVATFDVETDMLHEIGHIVIASATFKNEIFTAVQARFVNGISDVKGQVESKTRQYLGEYVERHGLTGTTVVCDDEIGVVRAVFQQIHAWRPDLLAIWNIDFDANRLIEACQRAQVDPRTIFCDPSLPMPYRIFKYKQGKKKRVTASGRVIPIKPAAQWHVVHCTSSFYWIDAMCVYKQIRLSKAEERSYSLDAILNKILGIRKLSFTEADKYKKARWHQFMQQHYPLEYIVYNRFDGWSMQELDAKTKDLAVTMPVFAESSGFEIFDSQPKQIATALYFECRDKDLVIGTVGSSMTKEPDPIPTRDEEPLTEDEEALEDEVLGLDGWIVTLKSINMLDDGVTCLQEYPTHRTGVRRYVFDSDSTAAYPSATTVANVSKETTRYELIGIEDVDEQVFRLANINMLSGPPNAIQYCTTMFGFPTAAALLAQYQAEKKTA